MFRPSAAPRWNIATRIFFFPVPCSAARASHEGATPTPAIAIADAFRKYRLLNMVLPPYFFWKSGELMTNVVRLDGVASLFSIPCSIAFKVDDEGARFRMS